MTDYLFAGPSLPDARQLASSGIEVLPPIAGGDILRLPLVAGDTVGIVDGHFHQQHAVRHKEILAVLAGGVRVLGAASMGALRAAELHPYGMEGIGGIYRDYRDGVLAADDEVALTHGPAETGYRPISQPLVNIRATLHAAQAAGLLDTSTREHLIGVLAATWYQRRTYRRLAEIARSCGMTEAAADTLRTFCHEHAVDRKRADALELVDELRNPRGVATPPTFELSQTIHLRQWQMQARGADAGDGCGRVGDLDVLRACQLFANDFPEFYRRHVYSKIVTECAAECVHTAGQADGGRTGMAIAHGVHRGIFPPPVNPVDFTFLNSWLTNAERGNRDLTAQVGTYLVRSYAVAPGVSDTQALAAEVTDSPAARPARTLVHATRVVHDRIVRQRPDFHVHSLSARRIAEWFAARWQCAVSDLELAALDRGLQSRAALIAAARPFYLAARYNPGLIRFRILDDRSQGGPAGIR